MSGTSPKCPVSRILSCSFTNSSNQSVLEPPSPRTTRDSCEGPPLTIPRCVAKREHDRSPRQEPPRHGQCRHRQGGAEAEDGDQDVGRWLLQASSHCRLCQDPVEDLTHSFVVLLLRSLDREFLARSQAFSVSRARKELQAEFWTGNLLVTYCPTKSHWPNSYWTVPVSIFQILIASTPAILNRFLHYPETCVTQLIKQGSSYYNKWTLLCPGLNTFSYHRKAE